MVYVTSPHGLWAARAEIRVPDDSSHDDADSGLPGPGPGYVNAFAPAGSKEHFQEVFEA